jgi:hypothetical protein
MTTYKPLEDGETHEGRTEETQVHPTPFDADGDTTASQRYAPPPHLDEADGEARQRQRFGGLNWGAGFFGWLVSLAVLALLTPAVAAGVAALGKTGAVLPSSASGQGRTVGIVAAAVLVGLLVVSYYSGGYVAGRMSRFDGGKQGVGVWLIGLLVTCVALGAVLLLRPELSALLRLDLPALALPAGASGVQGVIASVAALVSSLLAAAAGGKIGCRYHRKVDNAAYL